MDRSQRLDATRHLRGHAEPNRADRWAREPEPRGPAPTRSSWETTTGDGLPHQDDPGPLTIAWRDRWLLLLVALVTAASVYGLSAQMAPVYAAEATVAFPYTDQDIALQGGDAERTRTLRTEAERITSLALLEQAAKTMQTSVDIAVLQQRVVAIPAPNADVITVRATAPAPREAVMIADAMASAYRRQVDWRKQKAIEDLEQREGTLEKRIATQQDKLAELLTDAALPADAEQPVADSDPAISALRTALDASVSQLSDVQQRLDEARAKRETSAGGVQILHPAELPAGPEQPRPARNAATAVILALMAVTTIRWWRADPEPPRLEDAQSVEAFLGVPVVGEIPYLRRPPGPARSVTSRYPDIVDAYRMVAAAIPVRGSVLVTSGRTDESCADLVLNTAAALSRDRYRVLLVEGYPHGRLIGQSEASAGLTDVLTGDTDLGGCVLSGRIADDRGVWIIPWGTGSAGLPRSARRQLGDIFQRFAAHADVALIDGPPLASSADALTLAGHVNGILLMVSTGTLLSDIRRLRRRLDQLDRPVLGVVVTHTSSHRRSRRRRRPSTVPVSWTRPRPHRPNESQGSAA